MRMSLVLAAAIAAGAAVSAAQVAQPPAGQVPPVQTPTAPAVPGAQAPAPAPAVPLQPGQQPVVPTPVTPVLPINPRALTGQAGMIFSSVRPDRVVDFETVMIYLQEALEATTDATTRRQWQGLKIQRSPEPGPNSSVIYVWVIDPVVMGADYSIGPVLAAAYPEKVNEIWKLYQGSLIQQSVLNLNALVPPTLPATAAPDAQPITSPPAGIRNAPPPATPPVTQPAPGQPPATQPPVTPPPAVR
jgi:hypothetical protein